MRPAGMTRPPSDRQRSQGADGGLEPAEMTRLPSDIQCSRKRPPPSGRHDHAGKRRHGGPPALNNVAGAQIRGLSPKAHGRAAGKNTGPCSGPARNGEGKQGGPCRNSGNTPVEGRHHTPEDERHGAGKSDPGERLSRAVLLWRVGTRSVPGGTHGQDGPAEEQKKGAKKADTTRVRRHVRSCTGMVAAIRSSRRRQTTRA